MIPLQLEQNTSDTVSPLDKLLLERQVECLLMLNNSLPTSDITAAPPGKCRLFTCCWRGKSGKAAVQKKPFALVIIESAVSVELFLAAGGKVGVLTEDQQDLNYKILLKFLSPTNAPLYYAYKMLKYTARLFHDCSYMFRSTWTIIREPMPNLAKVKILWK